MGAKNSSARKKAESASRIGDTRIEAGRAVSARSRIRIRGLKAGREPEKDKVSLTLDRTLLQELRSRKTPLSSTVNELLHRAMEQERLAALVAALEHEAGPLTSDAYNRVLDQWFEDVDA